MSLPTHFDKPVGLGVIGGTGLYKLDDLEPVAELSVNTPWGKPASPITVAQTPSGQYVAFLARHGVNHEFTPSTVPAQANIAALKSLGVRAIIAFSAVGSLQIEAKPRDFVLPNQIIDRTKGIRPATFYGKGLVGHAGFGEPFDGELREFIAEHASKAMEGGDLLCPKGDEDLTLVCMEGPQFSTRAESRLYRSWGGTVINMSVLPEAKLAREAEIPYQMVCMVTDYDAWRANEEPVTVETIVGNLNANGLNAARVCKAVLDPLAKRLTDENFLSSLKRTMGFIITKPEGRSPELLSQLEFLHPGYYS